MKNGVISAVLIFFLASTASGHGVRHEIRNDNAVIIKALYDDGMPMSYAGVKIFSPKDKKIEFQNGRTDKNGNFAFIPDTEGIWRILVDDGTGHGFSVEKPVDRSMMMDSGKSSKLEYWHKILIALVLFLGLVFYFRKGKKQKEE